MKQNYQERAAIDLASVLSADLEPEQDCVAMGWNEILAAELIETIFRHIPDEYCEVIAKNLRTHAALAEPAN